MPPLKIDLTEIFKPRPADDPFYNRKFLSNYHSIPRVVAEAKVESMQVDEIGGARVISFDDYFRDLGQ